MSNRPRTNFVSLPSATCCVPTAPLDCSRYEPFMGSTSPAKKRVRLEATECLRIVGYTVPSGASVTVYAVDGGECASNLRAAYLRCGASVAITDTNRMITLCGPGWFEFQSSAAAGAVLLQSEKYLGEDLPCGSTGGGVGPVGPSGTAGAIGPTGPVGPAGSTSGTTPCAMGVSIPVGTITQYVVGIDASGCMVKQALQTIELRDCNNVLQYTFRAIL